MEIIHNLDYCDVLVLGEELRAEQESLQLQRGVLTGKHLDATNSSSGISVYGVDSMSNYEAVIRELRYFNFQPSHVTERRFRLTCSELNGRYTSNEFALEVSVLHSAQAAERVNHVVAPPQYLQLLHHQSTTLDLSPTHSSAVPSAATVLIVTCIAALVVVVVIGIYRIHITHQQDVRLNESNGDVTWDSGALNITVNPMESLEAPQGAAEDVAEEEEEEDEDEEEEEDDNITSGESDDSEEEADVQLPTAPNKTTHWDKTTHSF
ncbi:unnamed protein product [Knipowitschia caucasica]